MFKLTTRGIAALLPLVLLSGCIAQPGVSASAPDASSNDVVVSGDPTVISDTERAQNALKLEPIPATHPRARITADLAIIRAQEIISDEQDLILVEHGMGEPLPGQERVSVWMIVFNSSRVVPVGPANASHQPGGNLGRYVYEGVLIDDQTGELIRGFAKGIEIPPASPR